MVAPGRVVEPRIVWREGAEGVEVLRLVVQQVIAPTPDLQSEQRTATPVPTDRKSPD